jgi:hypothetical protein
MGRYKMKVLNFNTGRFYGPRRQPITAVYFEDRQIIAFADHGRDICGLLHDVDESFLNERSIMNLYDNGKYELEYDLEDCKLTKLAKILGHTSWVKKLGQWHLHQSGESTTLCGSPMLGSNYADQIPEHEREECPGCFVKI